MACTIIAKIRHFVWRLKARRWRKAKMEQQRQNEARKDDVRDAVAFAATHFDTETAATMYYWLAPNFVKPEDSVPPRLRKVFSSTKQVLDEHASFKKEL